MRTFLLALAIILMLTASAAAQTVQCDGASSGGTGTVGCDSKARDYVYVVTETPGSGQINRFYVGTDDGVVSNYTNICMPTGWTFNIVANPPALPGFGTPLVGNALLVKTPHGGIAGASSPTRFVIEFRTPIGGGLPGGTFRFGFDNPRASFDVEWRTFGPGPGGSFVWTAPVGMNYGPVHAPKDNIPDPTLSTVELIPPPTIDPYYVLMLCPEGDVADLASHGIVVDIWLRDSLGRPVVHYPADRMVLRTAPTTVYNNVIMCDGTPDILWADTRTNNLGQARMTGTPRPGGGCIEPGGYCYVYVLNVPLGGWVPITNGPTAGVVDMIFNSPDITGDLIVNLSDVALFASCYIAPPPPVFCCNLFYDPFMNLSDVATFASHIFHICL